ncbi:UbiA family prenyltransferase [Atopomonas sediminilitoris]|uniref:UbiA family prenyltransferase n=1 Tax=Atopomonas sediminilitoris TaxID=2919919 RepID=UPI001F4D79AB|nr:UbiA family prenyltransferase [Atopomonas sediminilitoris]MCJ8169132.1 UbiA family prenyltransferase [Atopomonas sediminilitoris]
MTTAVLTQAAPLSSRLWAWMQERFPVANALLFFILYLTTAAVVRSVTADSGLSISLLDLSGCLVTWSFFLLLRVFDEHKDYALDCQNHPQRVLQSGLITLGHLKALGVTAVLAQLGYSLWLDQGLGQVTFSWLALMGWTLLMGKEFFIGDWLNRHLTCYAVSHMLVMPLVVFWLANLAEPGIALSLELKAMILLAFISGFCFEITRKTKGPEEERDTIESYSRIFGTRGSALLVILLVTAMLVCQLWLLFLLAGTPSTWALIVLGAFYCLALRQLSAFLSAPSAALREKNEAVVALDMLAGYAVIIAVSLITHGVAVHLS